MTAQDLAVALGAGLRSGADSQAMTKSKGNKSRVLLGYHVTVAGKLARVERALAKLPSTSKSEKVDKPKGTK